MKPVQERYDPAFLSALFLIGVDADGQWRVYHATDRVRRDGRVLARRGDLADTAIGKGGYRRCSLPRAGKETAKAVLAHRVIWAIYHQRNPGAALVDHENWDVTDNDPEQNLRCADDFLSIVHRRFSQGSPLGVNAVEQTDGSLRYRARMTDPDTRKVIEIGRYDSQLEAQLAVDAFVIERRGPGAPTNRSMDRLSPNLQ